MGTARMLWLIGSGVGVMTAEMTKTAKIAYLKFLIIHRDVTRPMRDRKKTSVGISKTAPMPRSNFRMRLKYWSMVMTA